MYRKFLYNIYILERKENKDAKKLMSCLICMLMVIGICKTPTMAISEVTASGTQKAYIVGDDWDQQ